MTVSIVVVTRNPGADLEPLLEALARERATTPFELVVVDSGSDDGSAPRLQTAADCFLAIDPESFDHGGSRNLGIEAASGELVILLVQDALPEPGFIAALTAPFAADRELAGAFARQRPRPETSRLSRRMLGRWVAAGTAPRRVVLDSPGLAALSPGERLERCAFDDVASCLRRSVWCEHPFSTVAIAEDLDWSRRVLLAGWAIAYVPDAVVVHAHDRGPVYELARTRTLHRELGRLFGLRTVPDFGALLRAWPWTLGDHLEALRRESGPAPGLGEWLRASSLALVWPLGQYLGGRDAARAGLLEGWR